jgi:anti-sigma regulatory factor (Ser/Thr protein kinase)
MTGLADGHRAATLRHQAFLFHDVAEFVGGTSAFVRSALSDGQAVLVAVPQPHLDQVRSALGGDASSVEYVDMGKSGRNPGRIIPSVLTAFVEEHPAQAVAIVEEPWWPGRSPAEYTAVVEHEALINLAFADVSMTVLCPYDTVRLGPAAATDAWRTHPHVVGSNGTRSSVRYADPVEVANTFANRLSPRPAGAKAAAFGASDLRAIRSLVGDAAHAAGLPWNRIADLQHAVNELLTNTILHTRRPGLVYCWQDADTFVCEVSDSGRIEDPLAGRRVPGPEESTGRGLLLVNHLCDLVQLASDGDGTTIRLHMQLKPSEVHFQQHQR